MVVLVDSLRCFFDDAFMFFFEFVASEVVPKMLSFEAPDKTSFRSGGSNSHFFVNSSPMSSMHCSRAVSCLFLRLASAKSSLFLRLPLFFFLITALLSRYAFQTSLFTNTMLALMMATMPYCECVLSHKGSRISFHKRTFINKSYSCSHWHFNAL